MYIEIQTGAGASEAKLRDADNFREFKVSLKGTPGPEELAEALRPLGSMADEDHVMVNRKALLDLPGARPDDATWADSFQQMVDYADQHGWVGDDGSIRAHIDRGGT
jgi:hypothetical protein